MTIEEFIQECKKEFDPAKHRLLLADKVQIRIEERETCCIFCPLTFLAYVKHGKFHAIEDPEDAASDLDIDIDTSNALTFLADNEPSEYQYYRDDFDARRAELLAAFSVEAP